MYELTSETAVLLPERHTLHRSRGARKNVAYVEAWNSSTAVAYGVGNVAMSAAGQIILIGQS